MGSWVDISDFVVIDQLGGCRATTHPHKILFTSATIVNHSVWRCDRDFFSFIEYESITDRIHDDDYLVGQSYGVVGILYVQ